VFAVNGSGSFMNALERAKRLSLGRASPAVNDTSIIPGALPVSNPSPADFHGGYDLLEARLRLGQKPCALAREHDILERHRENELALSTDVDDNGGISGVDEDCSPVREEREAGKRCTFDA